MTPEQAIDNLNNAVAKLHTDRQTHVALQESVNVIRAAIAPVPGAKPEEPESDGL